MASYAVGIFGMVVTLWFAINDANMLDVTEPFKTQAALMNIGVNALAIGCAATTFAMPLWYGAIVASLAIPGDIYLLCRAANVTRPILTSASVSDGTLRALNALSFIIPVSQDEALHDLSASRHRRDD